MSEVTVFLAAFLGSFLGMLTAVVPVLYYVKKKLSNTMMGGMFG